MKVKDRRVRGGSIEVRKLDPLSQQINFLSNTVSQNSIKAKTRVRDPINSVSNNILMNQMQVSNQRLERIENSIRNLEEEQSQKSK